MSGVFTYDENGERRPFDPLKMHFAGCLLCGRRIAAVGIFIPMTAMMRAVVLRLRRHAVPVSTTWAIAYGVCGEHLAEADVTDRVETALVAAAERVVIQ